jgi:hypothetical protein
VTKVTGDRIKAEDNVTAISSGRDSPFDSSGKVKDAVDQQTGELAGRLDAINDNLINFLRLYGSGNASRAMILPRSSAMNF